MKEVLLGIATYRGAYRVAACLQSIQKHTPEDLNYEIVLCDDGSPDKGAALQAVGTKYNCEVICHKGNRGISASWNTLMNSREYPYKVILNDDILVTRGWLKHMLYFLKNNPKASGASWPLYFTVYDDYPKILGGDMSVMPRDPITKEPRPEYRDREVCVRPGRIMCFSGCCFAIRNDMWKTIGQFDENFLSFFEESDWGTRAASMGFASYGLAYPAVWHIWSKTFSESPELNAGWRMQDSRLKYQAKWNVPEKYWGREFDYTNPLLMPKIPPNEVKWLDPGDVERVDMEPPDTRKGPVE